MHIYLFSNIFGFKSNTNYSITGIKINFISAYIFSNPTLPYPKHPTQPFLALELESYSG